MAFKSGFVVLLGLPNAGKSTLLNRLLGRKLSIVSPKPQTTRHKLLGILNGPDHQISFLDTPGWLKPRYALQRVMQSQARSALLEDADAACLLVEPEPPREEAAPILDALQRSGLPAILAINKMDLAAEERAKACEAAYGARAKFLSIHRISASSGLGVAGLVHALVQALPEGQPFYPADQLTDRWERFFVGECVREALFSLLRDELPYACAVVVDQFIEERGRRDLVRATIYVERESQKSILVGKGGRAIRAVTDKAVKSAEDVLGRPIQLELWVKVRKGWREDARSLKEFGYHG